jgi:RimJ/RimL family protein N-acetyltransferase
MEYEIIKIEEQYIDGIGEAFASVVREQAYLSFNEVPPLVETRAFILGRIKGQWPYFIALFRGEVVGWCDISPLDRTIYAHVGELGIGIIDGHRDKGLGKRLIEAALDAAKKIGLTRIQLTVRENNIRAIKLYEHFGFVKEGLHINAEKTNGQYGNLVSMALLLK